MSTALVHIGTHKTGTTAFQHWAFENRDALLRQRRVALYEGLYGHSHFELAMICMRRNRTLRQRWRVPEWVLDDWQQDTRDHVAAQVAQPTTSLLITAEALSLLRYEDEVEALQELLSPRELHVAVCLRDPQSFLDSYRHEMEQQGVAPSRYRDSHDYVEPDTWLVAWDEMLSVWRRVLGEDRVVAFSYEESMARYDSSIPGVLAALSIDGTELPSWTGVKMNVRTPLKSPTVVKVSRKLRGLRAIIDKSN